MWYLIAAIASVPVFWVLYQNAFTSVKVKVVGFGTGPYPNDPRDDSYAWAFVTWSGQEHPVLMLRSRYDDQLVWVANGDFEWYNLVPQRVRDICEARYRQAFVASRKLFS